MNLLEQLTEILSTDERLVINGKLAKNKIVELALSLDPSLLKLLLSDAKIRAQFFTDVDEILVFDKVAFQRFISNKAFLPDSFTQFKNKTGLSVDDKYLGDSNDVVLSWPYKECVLEGGQTKEDQSRKEIFWNETLAPEEVDRLFSPKVLSNFKKYSDSGEELQFDLESNDNLVIKGNNLLALKSLNERFKGKVQLIYIDPPFNTERDSFNYNDRFSQSTWLTFMRNRLEAARELLDETGTIYIHLDSKEVHYLKVLCDEVFGRENFLNEIIWAYKERESSTRFYNKKHDTILFYAKNKNSNYTFNYNDIREEYSEVTIKKFKYKNDEGRPYRLRGKDGTNDPSVESENTYRQYLDKNSGPLPRDWFVMPILNQSASERLFDTQKSEALIRRFIIASTKEKDLVLDFFGGSGTTAAVAHKLNRRYIAIEQMESQIRLILPRLKNVIDNGQEGISVDVKWRGGGSFVYCQLAELASKYSDLIEQAKNSEELAAIWDSLKESSNISYKVDPKAFDKNIQSFNELTLEDQKRFLIEVIDKNQLYVNYSEIDDEANGISELDKKYNKQFYGV